MQEDQLQQTIKDLTQRNQTLAHKCSELQLALNAALARRNVAESERDCARRELAQVWRPIETAPKDGTVVLVWGLALEHEEPSWYKASFKADYREGKPYWHWGAPGYVGSVAATRWMPLPDPPAMQAKTAGEIGKGGRE